MLGELYAAFVDSKPGGGRALPLVALLVGQAVAVGLWFGGLGSCGGLWWGCWNGEGRHAVWRCRPSGFVVLWRCPTLPQPVGCSTIGAAGLSFQVRNGAGRFPGAVTTTRFSVQHAPRQVFGGVWVDRGVHSGCGVCCLYCFTPHNVFGVFV